METRLPPGPPLPIWVQTPLVWLGMQPYLDACHRRYGRTFTVRAAPVGDAVYITDPADVKAVFAGDPAVYHAGESNAILDDLIGPSSVLMLDEVQHRRRRALMTPPFHGKAVRRQSEVMAEVTVAEVDGWPIGRPFPLRPRMQALTLEVILRTVIGVHDGDRLAALRRALPPLADIGPMLMMRLMYPKLRQRWPWSRYDRRQAVADTLLYAEIEHARRDPRLEERPDVLAMLVRARDEDGTPMPDGELRDQLVTLLLAGHETTATALAWTFERLVRHPEILQRATEAAESGDDEYLDAVAKESMRLRPVLFNVARRLTAPVELDGYRLPAGIYVILALGLIQRSERHYPEPGEFRPERFLDGRVDPSTWFPFGGGVRRCLGATFAGVEMRIVLREVLRRMELAVTEAPAERVRMRHITLVPGRGATVTVARRKVPGSASGSPRGDTSGAAPTAR
ncbi:MAG: cytochrome P450 [Actinomycetota bacterium]|nr:cytochrome P450 [Actinomycetota bacterium]